MTVTEAEHARDAARARVTTTLGAIQTRLDPRTLARNAAREMADVATTGVDTVKRNPSIVAGLTAVAGLFLARHRIAGLFRRNGGDGTDRIPHD